MGKSTEEGYAELGLDFDTRLWLQLTTNHFPPVHKDFIPNAKEAIECMAHGAGDAEITMVNGRTLPAWSIIEQLHLDDFVLEVMGVNEEDLEV